MPAPFYADAFSPPSLKEKQRHIKSERRERGERGTARWTTAEVREIVQAASEDVHRYAQVLLMLNGGMGATDLSNLRDSEINWDTKIIDTDRSKTQVPRIVPLWDKTIAAMKISRANRAAPADKKFADRFFLTPHGQPLVIEQFAEGDEKRIKVKRTDALKNWFYQLLNGSQREKWKKKAIRLPHLKVHGGGVYTLRSVFVNLSTGHGQGQDENLVASILGWKTSNEIMQWYLRGDNSAKQRAIVEHVRKQIWPEEV
jgi:integrase